MPAVILGIRPGDQRELERIAARVGRPAREVAGILLEEAIRRAVCSGWTLGEGLADAQGGDGSRDDDAERLADAQV